MATRSDNDIQADIEAHLRSAGLPLAVSVEDGVVTLEGIVVSEEERQAALDLLDYVPDISRVVDSLQVRDLELGSPDALSMSASSVDEDQEGTATEPMVAAAEGLPYFPPTDPPIEPGGPEDAEVASGFATTSREDTTPSTGEQPGDSEIADTIIRELSEDAATSHLDVYVSVVNGVAILTGQVQDIQESNAAAAVAGRVTGVKQVVDRLVLTKPAEPEGEEPVPVHRRAQMSHVITPNSAWRATVIANHFRLQEERERVAGQLENLEADLLSYGEDQAEEGYSSSHSADIASDVAASETLAAEISTLRRDLQEIDDLLSAADEGRYGICSSCGRLIDRARLKALPRATRCFDCQRRYEDGT